MIDEGGIDERFAAVNLTPCAMADSERTQPERLAQARAQVEDERIKALAAEPWSAVLNTERPSLRGNDLFATRLAFDLLGCCADEDQVIEKCAEFYRLIHDPHNMVIVAASALKIMAAHLVPELLDTLERQAGDYDARVRLADAARNAWIARVTDLADGNGEAAE